MSLLIPWLSVHLHRTTWALADQAIVSSGMFLVQILLARHLSPAEYGTFALLFSGILALQIVNATLLFYPMSVRLVAARSDERDALLGASLVLIALLSLGLGVVLVLGLLAAHSHELIGPTLAWFLAWQAQEALRRGLLAELRLRAVLQGDMVTYAGQAVLLLGLARSGDLSIVAALHGMTAMALSGALLHACRLKPRFGALQLRQTLAEYAAIGGLRALGNGMLVTVRLQVLPWVLAVGSGPAATAGLQAAINIMNALNPVVIGLGNIVPQAASQSSAEGLRQAWRTALKYTLLASPLIGIYSLVIFMFPDDVLRLFYGASSDYARLGSILQLLTMANLVGLMTEVVIWFLQGVRAIHKAVWVNLGGAVASLVLTVPLVAVGDLAGGCIAMIGANGARLILAHRALFGSIAVDRHE